MEKDKENILKKFRESGFILDTFTVKELTTNFSFFLHHLRNDEVNLLEELYRIHLKKEENHKLTFLEEQFYKYLSNKYKKK